MNATFNFAITGDYSDNDGYSGYMKVNFTNVTGATFLPGDNIITWV